MPATSLGSSSVRRRMVRYSFGITRVPGDGVLQVLRNAPYDPAESFGPRTTSDSLPIVDAFITLAVCPPPAIRTALQQIQALAIAQRSSCLRASRHAILTMTPASSKSTLAIICDSA